MIWLKTNVVEIITDLEKLGKRAEEINTEEEKDLIREIATKLKRTMKEKNIVSLSAPAIGYNKRIFCIDFSDQEIKTYVNPLDTRLEGIEMVRESCTSIPDKEFIRPRNSLIELYYSNTKGEIKHNTFKGMASFVVQHEIDHLDGITLKDIGLELDEDFDTATEEEQLKIIDMYLKSLGVAKDEMIEEISKDENLLKQYDAERFVEMLAQGKITVTALQAEKEPEENAEHEYEN